MRKWVRKSLRRFLREGSGPTATEYAVLLVLIIFGALTAISLLGSMVGSSFQSTTNAMPEGQVGDGSEGSGGESGKKDKNKKNKKNKGKNKAEKGSERGNNALACEAPSPNHRLAHTGYARPATIRIYRNHSYRAQDV